MKIFISKIKNHKFIHNSSRGTLLFIALLVVAILFNCVTLSKKIVRTRRLRSIIPFYFPGFKFSGLKEILKIIGDISYIGYYTDNDLSVNKHAQQFSQAQLIVAPVILDTDYEKYEFILLDCSSKEVALKKIKEINAFPLKKNNFGIILAQRLR